MPVYKFMFLAYSSFENSHRSKSGLLDSQNFESYAYKSGQVSLSNFLDQL